MIVDTLPDQPAMPLPGVIYWASTSRYGDVRVMFLREDDTHYYVDIANVACGAALRRSETSLYLERPNRVPFKTT
jgi:hypothetical protein